eukprot:7788668-Pyramimonas_sp.AAC.1
MLRYTYDMAYYLPAKRNRVRDHRIVFTMRLLEISTESIKGTSHSQRLLVQYLVVSHRLTIRMDGWLMG